MGEGYRDRESGRNFPRADWKEKEQADRGKYYPKPWPLFRERAQDC